MTDATARPDGSSPPDRFQLVNGVKLASGKLESLGINVNDPMAVLALKLVADGAEEIRDRAAKRQQLVDAYLGLAAARRGAAPPSLTTSAEVSARIATVGRDTAAAEKGADAARAAHAQKKAVLAEREAAHGAADQEYQALENSRAQHATALWWLGIGWLIWKFSGKADAHAAAAAAVEEASRAAREAEASAAEAERAAQQAQRVVEHLGKEQRALAQLQTLDDVPLALMKSFGWTHVPFRVMKPSFDETTSLLTTPLLGPTLKQDVQDLPEGQEERLRALGEIAGRLRTRRVFLSPKTSEDPALSGLYGEELELAETADEFAEIMKQATTITVSASLLKPQLEDGADLGAQFSAWATGVTVPRHLLPFCTRADFSGNDVLPLAERVALDKDKAQSLVFRIRGTSREITDTARDFKTWRTSAIDDVLNSTLDEWSAWSTLPLMRRYCPSFHRVAKYRYARLGFEPPELTAWRDAIAEFSSLLPGASDLPERFGRLRSLARDDRRPLAARQGDKKPVLDGIKATVAKELNLDAIPADAFEALTNRLPEASKAIVRNGFRNAHGDLSSGFVRFAKAEDASSFKGVFVNQVRALFDRFFEVESRVGLLDEAAELRRKLESYDSRRLDGLDERTSHALREEILRLARACVEGTEIADVSPTAQLRYNLAEARWQCALCRYDQRIGGPGTREQHFGCPKGGTFTEEEARTGAQYVQYQDLLTPMLTALWHEKSTHDELNRILREKEKELRDNLQAEEDALRKETLYFKEAARPRVALVEDTHGNSQEVLQRLEEEVRAASALGALDPVEQRQLADELEQQRDELSNVTEIKGDVHAHEEELASDISSVPRRRHVELEEQVKRSSSAPEFVPVASPLPRLVFVARPRPLPRAAPRRLLGGSAGTIQWVRVRRRNERPSLFRLDELAAALPADAAAMEYQLEGTDTWRPLTEHPDLSGTRAAGETPQAEAVQGSEQLPVIDAGDDGDDDDTPPLLKSGS